MVDEGNPARESRKGLIDSVKGKAKELAGAVTGNDSLAAEGQLTQEQARERRRASTETAVADAEASEAAGDLDEQEKRAADARHRAEAKADEARGEAERNRGAEHLAAEQVAAVREQISDSTAEEMADRDVAAATSEAREEKRVAVERSAEAAREHTAELQQAHEAEVEAEAARRRAEGLADDADIE